METLTLSNYPIWIPEIYDPKQILPQYEHQEFYVECEPDFSLPGILLVKRYINFKRLIFKFCRWVTREIVDEIAKNLPQLEYLDLSGCSNIIGAFALDPLSKLKNITTVIYRFGRNIPAVI